MPLVALLYALFASTFTIAKTGLQYSPPLFFVGTRMVLGSVLIFSYLFFFKREHIAYPPKTFTLIVLLGLFNIFFTNVFEFWGLQYLTSAKACFLYSLAPFMAAISSYFYLGERMTGRKWLGMLIGFIGFLPVLSQQSGAEADIGHFFLLSWAELSVLAAATATVWGWIFMRRLVTDHECHPLTANAYSMIVGGILSLAFSAGADSWDPFPVSDWRPFLECTILLMIISNLICYNLYGHLLKTFTATFMSFAGFITPLFASFFGWLFLGELVTWHFFVAVGIVATGLSIFYQEELRQGVLQEAENSS
ncbi:MAG: EamA family transporter [Waddliaceae bacterium]|nr:EamA family transporter [Waddliaceae bacterium]